MKRFAGYLAVLPIAIGLLVWYLAKEHPAGYDEAAFHRALAPAEARFAACMLGQAPSRQPGPRLRDVSLAARGVADWPKRCAPYAEEYARVRNDHESYVPDLLREKSPNVATETVIDMLRGERIPDFDAVTRDVPRPPEPALAADPHTLHTVDAVKVIAGAPDLLVQLGEVACRFAENAGGLEPVARCSFLGDRFADVRNVSLVSGSGVRPLAHDSNVVMPWSGGEPIVSAKLVIPPSRVGDSLYGIVEGKRLSSIVHENGATRTATLDRPRSTESAMTLVADHLVWMENGRVFARSLAGGAPGKPVAVGQAAAGQMRTRCAHNTTLAVLVEVDNAPNLLALRVGDSWSLVGPIAEKDRELHCLEDRAVVMSTRVEDGNIGIARTDCTQAGCTLGNVEVPVEPRPAGDEVDAIPIGNDVLLAYASDAVWMRRAPLAALPRATAVPVYRGVGSDRSVRDSPYVRRLWLFPRGASVVMLLDAGAIGAIHLRDGHAEAVRVVYE